MYLIENVTLNETSIENFFFKEVVFVPDGKFIYFLLFRIEIFVVMKPYIRNYTLVLKS